MSQQGMHGVIGPLSEWASDDVVGLDERPIGAVLTDWAAVAPAAPAVSWLDGEDLSTVSYGRLAAEARALAQRLLRLAAPGDAVAVCAATSIDWLILEYASALAGTVLVPLNPAFTDPELSHMISASGAAVVLADEEFRGRPLRSRVAGLEVGEGLFVHELATWRDLPPSPSSLPVVSGDSAFLVQFTSGTTGLPKGALLSHRAAFNCARLSMGRLGGTAEDVWLSSMPMHHVGGSVSTVLTNLSVGSSVVLIPAFEPGLVLDLLARSEATITGAVPTMLIAVMEHPSFRATDLRRLRVVQSGGASVAPELIRTVEVRFGVDVVNAYGQSESPNAIQTSLDDDAVTKAETIGTPLPHREVRIVGSDGSLLPLGEVGEMWMRSPLVMDGYVGVDPETAAATLDANGWLHTGDLCSMDERGRLRLHGRLRDVIIRGGENIYPAEVEDVLVGHPGIAEIAVVGKPDERWGEVLVAFYRPVPDHPVLPRELEEYARQRLASFKVPRQWEPVDGFPLTASGKVKKYELRARVAPGREDTPSAS